MRNKVRVVDTLAGISSGIRGEVFMSNVYVPTFKDSKENRFFCLTQNMTFQSKDEAISWAVVRVIDYLPLGWIYDGVIEIDMAAGILHLECTAAAQIRVAVISGPLFDERFDKDAVYV
jgi:hypothetical protein